LVRPSKSSAIRRADELVFCLVDRIPLVLRPAPPYNAKRIRARDLWPLCHRLIRKVFSHTVAVWVNVNAGRPPLQLAALTAA
jgi:hypothetical protein